MTIEIAFHGAAGSVTGSCMELTIGGRHILIDCGMFQGSRTLEGLNHEPLPFDPADLDAVILTHAHLDHSGRLPLLQRKGLAAPLWCTPATAQLIEPLLLDAAKLQEADVQRRNRRPDRIGMKPFTRLYDANDVKRLAKRARPLGFGEWAEIVPGVTIRFHDARHILGAASVEIRADGQRLLFSGDIGNAAAEAHFHDGADAMPFDHLVCESTYGDRDRVTPSVDERRETLAKIVETALARGGNLLVPAFALERTQVVLEDLVALFDSGRLRKSPIFVDSPLAERVTHAYRRFRGGSAGTFDDPFVTFTQSIQQSRALNGQSGSIILAGSGMCNGGRIRHHLLLNLPRADSTVLFVGYQVSGTLGAVLQSGAPTVRISGSDLEVRAHIETIDAYSAHADHAGLLSWLRAVSPVSGSVFLDHGEQPALDRLADDATGLAGHGRPLIPILGERYALDAGVAARKIAAPHPRASALLAPEDWRNHYAAIASSLPELLRTLPSDEAREAALRAVERALNTNRRTVAAAA